MAPVGDDGLAHVPLDPDTDVGDVDETGHVERRRHSRQAQAIIIAVLACGGSVGALTRYWISLAAPAVTGGFPWATFLINVSGSAALGFLLVLLIEQFPRGRLARPVVGTGFLGAYTTFSTFMVDAVKLLRDGHPETAVAYVLATLAAGLMAMWLGVTGARVVLRAEHWLQEHAG